jgi:hypothetical protein
MKKYICLALVFSVILVSGCVREDDSKKSDIDLSNPITPSEAYIVCDGQSCPSQLVTLQGMMSRAGERYGGFVISDDTSHVYINLESSNLSMIDQIIFQENMRLEEDGIIEAKLTGKLSHNVGFCTMGGCQDIVNFEIVPEQTEVIREVGCKESQPQYTSEPGDCFDVSYRIMELEEAYRDYFSSTICTEKGRKPSGSFIYDSENEKWSFGISSPSRPGGCIESCLIYADKVVYDRTCATGSSGTDIELEESDVQKKSISVLYDECIERNNLELIPAEDEPSGAIRYDEYDSPWVKNEDGLWDGVIGIYWTQYRHDEESKNAPIGTIINETVDGFGVIRKKISDIEWRCFEREQRSITSDKVDQFPSGVNYELDLNCDYYLKKTL